MAGQNDFAKFSASQIADLIKQADAKAVSTLYVLGISTAALLTRINTIKASGGATPMWGAVFAVAVLLILVALKSVITVIYPRGGKPEKGDMTYFESIAANKKETYIKTGMALTDEAALKALYQNAYNLAKVAHNKYHALRVALTLTATSIVTTILILFLA